MIIAQPPKERHCFLNTYRLHRRLAAQRSASIPNLMAILKQFLDIHVKYGMKRRNCAIHVANASGRSTG